MPDRKLVSFLLYLCFIYYMSGVLISPPLNVHHLNPDFNIYFCQCPIKVAEKCDTAPDSCWSPAAFNEQSAHITIPLWHIHTFNPPHRVNYLDCMLTTRLIL